MNPFLVIAKSALMKPVRIREPYSWVGHIPLGAWLVAQAAPRILVELGTHTGNSYFSFCQSVSANGLSTRCYAVDTWCGDEHSGVYGEEVYQSVLDHNQRYYSGFSNLMRMTFDEAAPYFSEGSIDFLHIDGLHTYEAVKHDFETWRPKLSEKAIVAIHDTNVREREFGVWRLWEELSAVYPHLCFHHSHGLGVLLIGKEQPESMRLLLDEWPSNGSLVREFFGKIGQGIEFEWRAAGLEQKAGELGRSLLSRDSRITDLAQAVDEKDRRIRNLEKTISELNRSVSDRDGRIEILMQATAERERHINRLLAEQDKQVADFYRESEAMRGSIQALSQTVMELQTSTSWRITAPLRKTKKIMRAAVDLCLWRPARWMYRGLPLSYHARYRLRSLVFRHFAGVFRNTPSYQAWIARECNCPGIWRTIPNLEAPNLVPDEILSFPETNLPRVSIIVSLQGPPEMMLRHLKSLRETWSCESQELILIADGLSAEEQQQVFSRITGVRTIQRDRTGDSAWVLGAEAAGGDWLVLLRGDVHVLPNWLEELMWVFHHVDSAGLSGGKVIRAEGCIWTAGGKVDEGYGLRRIGAGEDPFHPAFNYLREVDFCSSIATMIPRELFLGVAGRIPVGCGPDEEGVYLAMAVRAAGKKVYYQPLSQVVLTPDSGIGENDECLGGRLDRDTLSAFGSERGFGDAPVKAVPVRGNLLVIDEWTPTPDQDSGSQDIVSYFLILRSLGFGITFIPAADLKFVERYSQELQRMGVECLYEPFVGNIGAYLEEFGSRFDLVMLYRPHCAAAHIQAVRRFCPRAKIIFNTVDLHYLREERQAAIEGSADLARQAADTKELELSVIRRADATILISPVEKELLFRELSDFPSNLVVVPLIRGDIPGTKVGFRERRGVIFIGGFQHQPNVDAVIWFGTEIWPLIRESLPQLECFVIGSNAPPSVMKLSGSGISILGHVPDIAPYFSACRVAVAPIRFGAGLKGKVVTSMGYGVPCVATPMAAEGIGLKADEEILVADDPTSFALAVVKLHEQEMIWQNLSEKGFAFIHKHYSLDAGKEKICEMLESLGFSLSPNDDGVAKGDASE